MIIKRIVLSLIAIFVVVIVTIFSVIGYGLFIYKGDQADIKINDFSKKTEKTLRPYKWKPYAMKNIKVKGYVNDTILIYLYSSKEEPIMKLKGNIEEHWYTDYYGEGPVKLIFDPYKATSGKIEIDFQL